MAKKKALLLGASSLSGRYLLKLLLQDEAYDTVTVYARKHINAINNKLVEKIIEPGLLDCSVEADDVFCCVDNDIKNADSQQAFEKANLDFPLKVAKLQKANGSSKFLIISTMDADKNSKIFHKRVNGKMEEDITAMGFPSLYIFRPAAIIGSRKGQAFAEKLKNSFLKIANPILVGPLKKYRHVSAKAIGRAMAYYAIKKETGTKIILLDEIKDFEL
jgi:uncharacterized protein YbjT (DUF2867 family)